ncbi:MAG TPA: hypothetical protein VFI25_20305 [Planctomycetota bacterium]|jgi:hypothetical protein|nr:hypothetical protein [Planctomycetota bacterium]
MKSLRGAAVLFLAAGAAAQVAPVNGHWEPFDLDTGAIENRGSAPRVVFQEVLQPAAIVPWMRVTFARATLEKGSAVRVTSLLDGDQQTLDAIRLEQWSPGTAYLNGPAVLLELVAGPGTRENRLRIEQLWVGDPPGVAALPESICGGADNRVPSSHPAIGRLLTAGLGGGCTGWILDNAAVGNDKCHLSSGQCFPGSSVLQFDVPASTAGCGLVHPPASQQFAVDPGSVASLAGGIGNDYAVFRCFANPTTGLTTFGEQGAAIPLAGSMPSSGSTVRVTGYGTDGSNMNNGGGDSNCTCLAADGTGTRNQVQQTHAGSLVGSPSTQLDYHVDTCGGSAGSPVLEEATGLAVGIHTHDGCSSPPGATANHGTQVTHPGLAAAIAATCFAPPPNDECAGATALFDGVNALGTSAGSTTSAPAWTCGSGGSDVWHSYAATCTGTTTFTLCPPGDATYDTVLSVYGGPCGALGLLGCNDDSACGPRSTLSVSTAAGSVYLVRVGGASGATGGYHLAVSTSCACVVFAEDFGIGGLGVYTETDAAGNPAPTLWHGEGSCDGLVPIPATMGANAAAYNRGDVGTFDYATGTSANGGAIESPVIPGLPSPHVTLAFDYAKETESAGTGSFDQCFVEARPAGGAWTTYAQVLGNSPCPTSTTASVALAGLSSDWQHRFRFDTVDGNANSYSGWTVDNVRARTSGTFSTFPSGCGSPAPTLTPIGTPGLGETVSFALGGVTGAPILWIGFPSSVPLCPGSSCLLGATFVAVLPVPSLTVAIPCDTTLSGGTVAVQGGNLFGPGGCLLPIPFTVSDTIHVAIG